MAARAAEQWGVVSRAQLRGAGIAPANVDYWVKAGRLRVMHRGVYAVGHAILRPEGHRLAAVLACGPGAVLSHRSAAAHWGLLGTDQERIDVTAPATRHGVPGIRLHRSRSLDARDTTSHEGVPITTIARTLLDLAATARAEQLERRWRRPCTCSVYDHRAIHRRHRQSPTGTAARRSAPPATRTRAQGHAQRCGRTVMLSAPSEAPVSRCRSCNEPFHAPDDGPCAPDFHWPAHRPHRRDRRLGQRQHARPRSTMTAPRMPR